jgi:hypothetical protein
MLSSQPLQHKVPQRSRHPEKYENKSTIHNDHIAQPRHSRLAGDTSAIRSGHPPPPHPLATNPSQLLSRASAPVQPAATTFLPACGPAARSLAHDRSPLDRNLKSATVCGTQAQCPPGSQVWMANAKAGSSQNLTRTAWVRFLPSPRHFVALL